MLELKFLQKKNVGEYATFLHLGENKRFYNFKEVGEEIKRETDKVTGKNKGISSSPITLTIHSEKGLFFG